MKLDELEKLADAAIAEQAQIGSVDLGDTSYFELFSASANPATIKQILTERKQMRELIRQCKEALRIVRFCTPPGERPTVEKSLAAIEAFERGES
jgi:hypothetical protein